MSEKPVSDELPVSVNAAGEVVMAVRVIPRARQTRIAGVRGGALVIKLAAAPVDGAANEALVEYLSRLLDCPRRHIHIASGDKSRAKRITVAGTTAAEVTRRLKL